MIKSFALMKKSYGSGAQVVRVTKETAKTFSYVERAQYGAGQWGSRDWLSREPARLLVRFETEQEAIDALAAGDRVWAALDPKVAAAKQASVDAWNERQAAWLKAIGAAE